MNIIYYIRVYYSNFEYFTYSHLTKKTFYST